MESGTSLGQIKIKAKKPALLKVVDLAIQHSNGRLRLVFNGYYNDVTSDNATRFLELDGKRLGRDIELYCFAILTDPQQTLPVFFEEIIFPLKETLPESYKKASEALCVLGEPVFPNHIQQWRDIF